MAPPSVTDAQLIARVVVQDDRHAFSELVRRHQSAVRATLRRLTAGNFALADDDDGDARPSDGAGGDHARAATLRLDMERALAILSEGERAAIVQCYHNDLSHEEAAYVLNCPVGTVKTHILRAKQKLKSRLAAWAPS